MTMQCRTFPGGAVTDNVEESVMFTPTPKVSYSFWVNLGTIPAGAGITNVIMDSSDTFWPTTTNLFQMQANNWTLNNGNWNMANPSTGVWHHIGITYDYGSTANIPVMYLDGVSQSVTTINTPTGAFTTGSQRVTIGNNDQPASLAFNGSVFGVARWGGILLSAAQMAALAAGQPPCSIAPGNMTHYYPLDQGESPEPDLVSGTAGVVTGSTVGTGPAAVTIARCPQPSLLPRMRHMRTGRS